MAPPTAESVKAEIESFKLPAKEINYRMSRRVYLREAQSLAEWAEPDREMIIHRGYDIAILDVLPFALGHVYTSQSVWYRSRYGTLDDTIDWEEREEEAWVHLKELRRVMVFAYAGYPAILKRIRGIKGSSISDLVQGLHDLCGICRAHPDPLTKMNFEMELLTRSEELAHDMGPVIGSHDVDSLGQKEEKILRDKGMAYVKQCVDALRVVGRFVNHGNPARLQGYYSAEERRKNVARAKVKKAKRDALKKLLDEPDRSEAQE